MKNLCNLFLFLSLVACNQQQLSDPIPIDEPEIYKLPVVVHIIHQGEPIGQGTNLSFERVEEQIRILNEDFRRKEGSPGFNQHPDGGDAQIEFILAKVTPEGSISNGLVRVDTSQVYNPIPWQEKYDHYAYYSYWNPEDYINIWVVPLPGLEDLVLGFATGPETDLPGGHLLVPGEPVQAEGIIINSAHFGKSSTNSAHNLGRTLTHEMGHYLGLLHTWGANDCENNDYCEDTPPAAKSVAGCSGSGLLACNGLPAMVENYMTYSPDHCMNIFTKDQIARMHYVLQNSPRRKSLLSSPALGKSSL